ncbi:MAG: hypothetical protein KatS3mg035_0274 [Bacteroidia bacterium]|nr:MAG: hypothetical protein KatS3mg035_0274 [Bacteroidia bacterium]
MKKIFTLLLSVIFITGFLGVFYWYYYGKKDTYLEKIKAQYYAHKSLSKKDLKKIPKKDRPDLAKLQDYLRTLDPSTGKVPTDGKLLANIATWDRIQSQQYRSAIPGGRMAGKRVLVM